MDSGPISAQKAYDFLLSLISEFKAETDRLPLSAERKEDFGKESAQILEKAYQKPHKAAIVGRTGVGKSTLLNALLQHPVLSASASGACTAVPIEVSYKATEGTEATIEFISAEQWRTDLCRLFEDATDKTVDVEEKDDSGSITLAYQAQEKLRGIFPDLRNVNVDKWKLDELLHDSVVGQYLDRTVPLSASESDVSFERKLEQFLASDPLTGTDTRKLWPLVKIVKIKGKFEVLSTGITLVDLPGHGDVDNARDSVANEYLKSADSVFLVANITRAKDDRDIHTYLYKHLSQIIVDGRVRHKTISLILTAADSSIGTNECTLEEGTEQERVDVLTQESIRLSEEIRELVAKKEKKEKSKAKKKNAYIQQYQDQIVHKKQLRESKNRERSRLLASGRSRIVSNALQAKYSHLYRDLTKLSSDADIPPLPIFCLGSRDYLCLKNIELNEPTTFFNPDETGIPKLKRYLENDGASRSLSDAITIVTGFYEFLSRACQIGPNTAGDDDTTLAIHNAVVELEKRCETRLNEMITQITTAYGELQGHIHSAVSQAETASPEVFAGHAKRMRWNQYRAMMRLQGQYEGGNLNTDLVKTILPALSKEWNVQVNVKIPLFLQDFYTDIQDDLTITVKAISEASTLPNADSIRKSLGIETFIKNLNRQNEESTSTAQRQGSRRWEPLIKAQLCPQYEKVSAEKGGGMFKRMKAASPHSLDHI
ncbi:hypothetical protein FB451DRAFT_1217815 [Mycena latifolia]|nr:hypothetical protein FB451DRAFT_1217815 [Mycena latifolia]